NADPESIREDPEDTRRWFHYLRIDQRPAALARERQRLAPTPSVVFGESDRDLFPLPACRIRRVGGRATRIRLLAFRPDAVPHQAQTAACKPGDVGWRAGRLDLGRSDRTPVNAVIARVRLPQPIQAGPEQHPEPSVLEFDQRGFDASVVMPRAAK